MRRERSRGDGRAYGFRSDAVLRPTDVQKYERQTASPLKYVRLLPFDSRAAPSNNRPTRYESLSGATANYRLGVRATIIENVFSALALARAF